MLNITGGGVARYRAQHPVVVQKPHLVVSPDAPANEIKKKLQKLLKT